MMIYQEDAFAIAFGTAQAALDRALFIDPACDAARTSHHTLVLLQQQLGCDQLVFARQQHGADGVVVTTENRCELERTPRDGDYLLTQLTDVGLGVYTADCVPAVLYDPQHHAVAIVHAGWRGMVKGVVPRALEQMQHVYGTDPGHVRCFIGPAAQACCYEVGPDVVTAIKGFAWHEQVLCERGERWYCDVAQCTIEQLAACGVLYSAIRKEYHVCTMCEPGYCSYRRDRQSSQRQVVAVVLRENP